MDVDNEIYSNPSDCYDLNTIFYRKLGKKLVIYGSLSNPLINGKYYYDAGTTYSSEYQTISKGMQFFGKYCKDGFLRIELGKSLSREVSDGEKLAGLSDICDALKEDFGMPDVFYTVKDDDDERLSLQWTIKDKELNHEKMEYDMYFDDANIDKLIFIDTTRPILDDEIGLPVELYPLVRENIDEFVKHKKGLEKEEVQRLVKTRN